jgi:hypothetical protein
VNDFKDLAPDGIPQEQVDLPDPRRNWGQKPRRPKVSYIRTIPVSWFVELSKLPGKTPLIIGMALQYRVGVSKTRAVKLNRWTRKLFGLQRHQVSRGVDLLERADLIRVQRDPGRLASITVLDVESPSA